MALESSSEDEETDLLARQRRMRIQEDTALGYDNDEAGPVDAADDAPFDLDTYAATPLNEWIHLEAPRREVKRMFSVFLNTFIPNDEEDDNDDSQEDNNQDANQDEKPIYVTKMHEMYVPFLFHSLFADGKWTF